MKRYIRTDDREWSSDGVRRKFSPIVAMSVINPQFCRNHTVQVELEQRDEGPIPHLHVYHDHTCNPKKCSYVRLDKAEYSPHHPVIALPKNVKQEFIECMSKPWTKQYIASINGDIQIATGYEAAVSIWVDTYEGGSYSKFNLDENGIPIMPNYEEL